MKALNKKLQKQVCRVSKRPGVTKFSGKEILSNVN